MTEYDLSVDFAGLKLKNPLIADSAGYSVSSAGLRRLLKAGFGAVVTKSCTYDPMPSWPRKWEKSPVPRVYWDDLSLRTLSGKTMDGTEALINPGYKRMAGHISETKALAQQLDSHIIGSFSPRTEEEAMEIAREFENAGASAIHMDLACSTAGAFRGRQHPGKNYERLGHWWAETPERTSKIIKATKDAVDIPVVPKVIPFAVWARDNPSILRSIEDETNLDAFAIHTYTIPGCVWIDIFRGRPYSYPRLAILEAVVPLSVGNTLSLARATKKPIFSSGGVSSCNEVVQMIMAGATAVGLCRAIYKDIKVGQSICDELESYMASQALESLDDIRGLALKHKTKSSTGLALEHEAQAIPLLEESKLGSSTKDSL
ncbi:MAG: hypothetical protein ACRECH_06035 [Nitrososphaerales archaeon]